MHRKHLSTVKLVVLGLLAVSAFSAVASATASAHEYKVEGVAVVTEKEVEGIGGGEMESTVAGLTTIVQCEAIAPLNVGNNIKKAGKSEGAKGESKNCGVAIVNGTKKETVQCLQSEPVIADATGELTGVGEGTATGNKAAGEVYSEGEFRGVACSAALKGVKFTIKGKGLCTSPESGVEAVTHEAVCTPGGSKLVIKEGTGATENPVKLWGGGVAKLKTGEKWSSN